MTAAFVVLLVLYALAFVALALIPIGEANDR